MKRTLILIISLVICQTVFSQRDSLFFEVKISSIQVDGDTLKLKPSISLYLTNPDTSSIISIGRVGQKDIGIQLELFKTKIGPIDNYVICKAIYLKNQDRWDISHVVLFSNITPKIISSHKEMKEGDFESQSNINNSYGELKIFGIEFAERFYKIR